MDDLTRTRGEVTRLLGELSAGDGAAAARLVALVYDELRGLAEAKLRNEPASHTLQPTALVHEAYLRLMGGGDVPRFESRAHFFGAAAEAMRRVLVDHARRKRAAKRGGGRPKETLSPSTPFETSRTREDEVVAVDEALARLAGVDRHAARVVELRFFGGLSIEQTAEVMGVSPRTVKRRWTFARAWLLREIGPG